MSQPRQTVVAVTMDFDVLRRYHHWRSMLAGIIASGAVPLTIDCRHPRADLDRLVGMADGLILLGGADVNPELYGGDSTDPLIEAGPPSLDDNEIAALNVALRGGTPVLAICRGAQLTNVALGERCSPILPATGRVRCVIGSRRRNSTSPHTPSMSNPAVGWPNGSEHPVPSRSTVNTTRVSRCWRRTCGPPRWPRTVWWRRSRSRRRIWLRSNGTRRFSG